MDVERGRSTTQEEKEEPIDTDDSTSSVFSWHHAEGPRSLRRASTSRSASRDGPDRTLSRTQTLERSISRLTRRTTTFQHPLTREKTTRDALVQFDGEDDPYQPLNWPFKKKAVHTIIYGFLAMTTSFATAVYSSAAAQVAIDFNVSTEVAILGIALLLFGMGIGPLLWGPFSELYGRKWCVLLPVFISACFSFAGSYRREHSDSHDRSLLHWLLRICSCHEYRRRAWRYLGAKSSWSRTHRVLDRSGWWAMHWSTDWKRHHRVVSGLEVDSIPDWHYADLHGSPWCHLHRGDISWHAPRLQGKTTSPRIWKLGTSRRDGRWDVSISELGHKYLVRPVKILMTPIGALMIFYASFCYGLIYACLGAFPYIFEGLYSWTPVQASLPFLAELIGILGGCAINAANQNRYARKMQDNGGKAVPEARLYPMMFGSPLLAAGIFLLAWTAEYKVFWVVPCIAIIMIGTGFFTIFQGALNYLIDTFLRTSASAIAANTFVRSVLAGVFPLFLNYQLNGIGVGWGLSVYGFVAALLLPVPYVFFLYGARIRAVGPKID